MRSVADFRLANLVTGFTPGRLFQISTRRLLSGPIRSANCSSLAKAPRPVSRAALREAWTVMLFSESIVNVFMVYAARKCVVEPVFGQIKQARGFRQFLLRGKAKVQGEWALVCLTHNILRLFATQ